VEPAAKQKVTAELEKLEIERTKNQQEQQERRRKLTEDDAKFEIDVQLQRITALNQLSSVSDERTIASLKSLGSLRLRSEEEVAARIVQIQVAALDREEQLLEARQAVVARITDPQERAKADAELTTELSSTRPSGPTWSSTARGTSRRRGRRTSRTFDATTRRFGRSRRRRSTCRSRRRTSSSGS
jgi:hypothetical protein